LRDYFCTVCHNWMNYCFIQVKFYSFDASCFLLTKCALLCFCILIVTSSLILFALSSYSFSRLYNSTARILARLYNSTARILARLYNSTAKILAFSGFDRYIKLLLNVAWNVQ